MLDADQKCDRGPARQLLLSEMPALIASQSSTLQGVCYLLKIGGRNWKKR
jgi:hypothetical protein